MGEGGGFLPACWSDDSRMGALFAPIRSANANPADRSAKIAFWSDAVERRCRALRRPLFDALELEAAFARGGKRPAALAQVLQDLADRRVIVGRTSLGRRAGDGWLSRGFRWILARTTNPKPLDKAEKMAHVPMLGEFAAELLASMPAEKRVVDVGELKKSSKLDEDAFEAVLDWMLSTELASASEDGKVCKLAADEKSKATPLTESESSLVRLDRTKRKLEEAISACESEMATSRESAKASLAKGSKPIAMHHLKKKKMAELKLVKLLNSLESIAHLHDTILQTHSDGEVIEAYKHGLKALKINMKEKGLDEDNAYDTMDDLKQVLEEYRNVEAAISQPIDESIDMSELESELEALTSSPDDDEGGDQNVPVENTLENLLPDLHKLDIKDPPGEMGKSTKVTPAI